MLTSFIFLATDVFTQPWFIIIMVIVFFGLLGGGTYTLYRYLHRKSPTDTPANETDVVEEQLSHILEPIDDEATKQAMDDFDKTQKEDEQKNK
jgi:capsule polysaccharide export protein KpsE/RkpR